MSNMNQSPIELIEEALYSNLEYKFNKAQLPMIRFSIYENKDETFSVTPLFHSSDNDIHIKVKVIHYINSKNKISLVLNSGSIETSIDDEDKIFTLLSTAIFQKIAEEASRMKANKTGLECYHRQLKRLHSEEFLKVSTITYVDFESLDIQDIDWSDIYAY